MAESIEKLHSISADELIRRARAMIPVLAERAAAAEAARKVPVETVAEMEQAGLFRVLQPKRYGGFELPPRVFYEIQMALAEGRSEERRVGKEWRARGS